MDEAALDALGDMLVDFRPHLHEDRAALIEAASAADAVIVRNRTIVDRALLEAAPSLRAVGRLGVGLDNIDVDECRARGVAVLPATGANAASVAEYVIAAAMTLVRGAFQAHAAMIAGHWPRAALGGGGEIAGRTMGCLGFGATARAVAWRARALGMSAIAFDPEKPAGDAAWQEAERADHMTDVLARADVLSIHVPLTAETRHLVDARAIAG